MAKPADLLQGTLDMLILKAVSLGPLHGYGVLLRIQQISQQPPADPAGLALSRALSPRAPGADRQRVGRVRQQPQGAVSIASPPAGRRQLAQETRDWKRMADIIAGILETPPEKA